MKSFKVLISLALSLAIILSVGTVYAATDLEGGFFGHYLDKSTDISVSDGTLTATQNADTIYNYVDTNFHNNFGFEDSNEAINTSGDYKTFTSGWTTSDGIPSANSSIEITNISHSGKNALKITGIENMEYRIFNTKSNATNSTLAGITEGLDADTTYLVSYWVKGNAASRVYAKSYSSNAWNYDWGTKLENPGNLWKLYTKEVKTNSSGEAWYNVYVYSDADTEIYLDDICLQTKAQAIANVETMIQKLDVNSKVATRAIDDINQWVSVLGAQKISNYADFEAKLKQYASIGKYEYVVTNNLYLNPGFEESDVINNSSGKAFYSMTEGWTSPWSNSKYVFSLSDVSHSGNKSIYIKLPVGSENTMLVNRKNIVITSEISTDTDGRMYGLTSGEKYIMSYWVKGDAATRAWLREIDANGKVSTSLTTSSQNITAENDWKLFAAQFTPNTSGEIYCVLNYTCNSSSETEAYIDDVSMQTVSDAIRSVETMIDNLNTSAPYAARAIDDIEQWITALGSENISNYDLFLMKKSGYVYYSDASTLDNTGFEKSDSVNSFNGDGYNKELTTGWTTNYGGSNVEFGISNDAHSGNNSLSIDVKAGQNGHFHSSKNYIYTSNVEGDEGYNKSDLDFRTNGFKPNTEYIISYWVKGTGQTYVWGRTVDNEGKNSGEYRGTYIVNPGDTWMLGTNKITTNSNGEFWFNIFANNTTDSNITATIDDIQVLTVEENIAFVDSLIDQFAKLDNLNANYARAKADIEAWLPVLNNADLNLKYDIVLNEKYNIITPNEGYTNLVQGDYIASVALKGNGEVNRVYGDNITNITSITTKLSDEYFTHRKRVTVDNQGTYYMGVQLKDTTNVNSVKIKNFSLKRVGDVNESGEIDIRDMVRMAKGLNGTDTTVDALVADYDNSSNFDRDDIAAVRELVLNKDLLS